MRKQKHLILSTAIILGLSGVFASTASANTDLDRIQAERDTIQSEIAKQNEQLTDLEKEIQQINEQIERVEQAIKDNEKMIADTEEAIVVAESEIAELEKEIAILEEQIEARFDLLKDRAVSYHQNNSNSSFLEVVFGSTSFSNFIERVVAMTKIAEADNAIIEQLEEDQAKIEDARAQVATKLGELEDKQVELEGMKHHIIEQQEQNEALKAEVEEKVQLAEAERDGLTAQDSDLAARAADIEARQNQVVDRSNSVSLTSASNTTANTSSNSNSQPAAVSNGNGNIQVAMDAGRKYIGNSVYVFGGGRSASDIANGRFDCSGFVAWAMRQAGYQVPASTDGLRFAGQQIAAGDRQPGDLVFFNTYKTDGHVGIYLGNNKFIGSQSSTGVAIADMSSGYWKNTFSGRVVRVH